MSTHTRNCLLRALTIIGLVVFVGTPLSAQKPELEFEGGHNETIYALAISPNDKYLASAGAERRVIVWDLVAAKQLYSLKAHSEWIFTLAFSPDSQLLASGSSDGIVKLWSVAEGKQIREISLPYGHTFVAFSPEGKTLAIACTDNLIRLWDVPARKMKGELSGHTSTVSKIVFVDEKHLLSSDVDGVIRLWDLTTAQSEIVTRQRGGFRTFTYSNGLIASASSESISIFELVTKKPKRTIPVTGSIELNAITFTSKKELAYVDSGVTTVWDIEEGKQTGQYKNPGGPGDSGSYAVTVSQNRARLVFSDSDNINLVDLSTKKIKQIEGGFRSVTGVILSPNGKALAAALGLELGIWGDRTNLTEQEASSMAAGVLSKDNVFVSSANVIAHVRRKNDGSADSKITLIDVAQQQPDRYLRHNNLIQAIDVNPKTALLATSSEDGTIKIWDVRKGLPVKTLKANADLLSYSPDGKLLATVERDEIKLWNVKTWRPRVLPRRGSIRHILFSPNSEILAALIWGDARTLDLWDVSSGKYLRPLIADSTARESRRGTLKRIRKTFSDIVSYKTAPGPMAFSDDGELIACEGRDSSTGSYYIKVWKVRTGEELHRLDGHSSTIRSIDFVPNSNVLVSGSWDKTIKFWNPRSGEELATLIPLNEKDWVIFTPDGRFDTNTSLDDVKRLHWVMPGDALNPLPLDIFMRDYYEPKLLERILAGAPLRPVRDISTLNRTQPGVVIKEVRPDGPGTAQVTVEVTNVTSQKQVDAKGQALQSGVFDVRLFRDGQMVANSTNESALETYVAAAGELNQSSGFNESELRLWREAHQVRLENGRRTLIFPHIKLPQNEKATEIEFSAYAFNNDRVKSNTARQIYRVPATPQPRKPRAYVITIGVNLHENPDFNLLFAANDARLMQQALTTRLMSTGQYAEVVPVSLISDSNSGIDTKALAGATKANFRALLRLLTDGGPVPQELQTILNADKLKPATPDDLVLILFAGHGFTGTNGLFYLVPYDTGSGRGRGITPQLQQHSISNDELSLWLRKLDAGRVAFIVDACHSAGAVESTEFKPGPMGSRGLGQLAYDKGMLILAATQVDRVAYEGTRLRQGFLTYALVRQGLEESKADFDPADGTITLREWLNYGVAGVPHLFDSIVSGKAVPFRDVSVDEASQIRTDQQQPSLFDFARRGVDVTIVSGPSNR